LRLGAGALRIVKGPCYDAPYRYIERNTCPAMPMLEIWTRLEGKTAKPGNRLVDMFLDE
jgi:hypothetical protein